MRVQKHNVIIPLQKRLNKVLHNENS